MLNLLRALSMVDQEQHADTLGHIFLHNIRRGFNLNELCAEYIGKPCAS